MEAAAVGASSAPVPCGRRRTARALIVLRPPLLSAGKNLMVRSPISSAASTSEAVATPGAGAVEKIQGVGKATGATVLGFVCFGFTFAVTTAING